MKRISVKYLAGLIDGEGCIDWQRGWRDNGTRLYIRPRLRITLTEPGFDLLENLHANFKGHVEVRNRSLKNPNWMEARNWVVTGSRAVMVLNQVKNSLIIKKEQAKLAIAWERYIKGERVSQETIDILVEEMKLMKKDPHRLSEKAMIRTNESLKR